MIRALLVGIITVIAMAAALLAAESHSAPPLMEEAARADMVMIDKSDRKLMLYRDDEVIYHTEIALGADPGSRGSFSGNGVTPVGEFQVSQRNDESKFYLSLALADPAPSQAAENRAMIHGQPNITPGALTLPGDWTDGDIAVSNTAMRMIWRRVALGAKVVVRP